MLCRWRKEIGLDNLGSSLYRCRLQEWGELWWTFPAYTANACTQYPKKGFDIDLSLRVWDPRCGPVYVKDTHSVIQGLFCSLQPCCTTGWNSILVWGQCHPLTDRSYFTYPYIHRGHLLCFQPFGYCDEHCSTITFQIPTWGSHSQPLIYISRSRVASMYGNYHVGMLSYYFPREISTVFHSNSRASKIHFLNILTNLCCCLILFALAS